MKRLKSIDALRGISILWMFLGHLLDWWLINNAEDRLLYIYSFSLFDVVGAGAFLFVSGISSTLSYRTRLKKNDGTNANTVRNEYLFRGFFVLIAAIIYNIPIAIFTGNIFDVWIWYVLLTVAISLLLAWPFLRISKSLRAIIAIGIILGNQALIFLLYPHEGSTGIYGILYHIFYNGHPIMDPLLTFFPFFLVGTIFGDLIHEAYIIEDKKARRDKIKRNILFPSLACGNVLILIGVFYQYPEFLNSVFRTFSWVLYSLGFQMILFSLLLSFDAFELIKTKKSYKFLYYFSYYSLSIFLVHNLLYFVFYRQLSAKTIMFFIAGTIVLVWLLLKVVHDKCGKNASLKAWISIFAVESAKWIETRNNSKLRATG